jgi:hypothetical protein
MSYKPYLKKRTHNWQSKSFIKYQNKNQNQNQSLFLHAFETGTWRSETSVNLFHKIETDILVKRIELSKTYETCWDS